MRLRKIIQDYFTFSRKERNGIVVLLLLVVLFVLASQLVFVFERPETGDVQQFLQEIAEFRQQQNEPKQQGELFIFNPNTIDSLALDSLLVPAAVKQNILRFRKKGGHFFRSSDLRKIYGMNDSVYNRLKPFIFIETENSIQEPEKELPKKTKILWRKFDPDTCNEKSWEQMGLTPKQSLIIERYKKAIGGFKTKEQLAKVYGIENDQMDSLLKYVKIKEQPIRQTKKNHPVENKLVELNSADTIALKSLPGIGTVLSSRIIKYRNLLGGFYSARQLLEVYGVTPECLSEIEPLLTIDTLTIKKLDINFSSAGELAAHPYIGKNKGREIATFRSKNGPIVNPLILFEKGVFEKQQFDKIRPYLATKTE